MAESLKFLVALAPLTVTDAEAGVKSKPSLLGVTVYVPFGMPENE